MGRRLKPTDCTVAACPLTVTDNVESAGATNWAEALTRFQFVTVAGSGALELIARTSSTVGDKMRRLLSPTFGIASEESSIRLDVLLVVVTGGLLVVTGGGFVVVELEPELD